MPKRPTRPEAPARKRRSDGQEARVRILDSAEVLFAERGFHGTSIRDITEHAGVRLAAVNYHFVSKEALLRDVLQRRAAVLEAARIGGLARLPVASSVKRRTVALVRAFVAPLAPYARDDQGFRNYLALIAQLGSSRLHALLLVENDYNQLARRFVSELAQIYPQANEEALHHGYTFMLAATLYSFSNNLRLNSMTHGRLRSDDFEAITRNLTTFISHGLNALLRRPSLQPDTPARSQRRRHASRIEPDSSSVLSSKAAAVQDARKEHVVVEGTGGEGMTVDAKLLDQVRAALEGAMVREVKMFGGIGFMLNGNMVAAASARGLLVRVGEEASEDALTRPGASQMVMRGRALPAYIRVAPEHLDARAVKTWVKLARKYVETLPPKKAKKKKAAAKSKKAARRP